MPTSRTIGAWIRRHRKRAGLSQKELGKLLFPELERSQSRISNWENGYNDVGRLDFGRLCVALGVPEAEWPKAMRLPTADDEAA